MSTSPAEQNQPANPEIHVSMEHVVRFVRQLGHDLRNHLNAAELQTAFMNEIAADQEMKDEVRRLRTMLAEMGGSLQRLSSSLAEPRLTLMPYEAAAFIEDLRQKVAAHLREKELDVEWKTNVGAARFEIDPQILQQALLELFANASQHGPAEGRIFAAAETRDGVFEFTLREPARPGSVSTAHWGLEPFRHVRHGHYGVGLHRARRIIEAHRGTMEAHFDPATSSLATQIVLPTLPG
jgi:signal transduction histidine kinase